MRTPDNQPGSTTARGQSGAAGRSGAAAYEPPVQEVRVSSAYCTVRDPSQERALMARGQPSIQSRLGVVKYNFLWDLALRRTPYSSRRTASSP